jgi:hypothetical protein
LGLFLIVNALYVLTITITKPNKRITIITVTDNRLRIDLATAGVIPSAPKPPRFSGLFAK